MENRKPNTKWIEWINEYRDKLTFRNYEDETLSSVSFKAGYKQAVIDAGRWWLEYLSKSENCETEERGSADDIVLKFLKDIWE